MIKLRDIAEKADVTVSTVSAALNGTGRVSEKRREEILAVANELGYRPNLAAKLLKSHENRLLGLVISDQLGSFAGHGVFSGVMAEFLTECHDQDWRPHFELFNYESDENGGIPAMFTDGLAAGCLFCGYLSESVRAWLDQHPDFPLVAFGEPYDYAVRTDGISGVFNAVQYLVATGHKRINVICGPTIYDVHSQTVRGFHRAASEFGLDISGRCVFEQTTLKGEAHTQENLAFLDEIISSEKRPDALLLAGTRLTTTALYHLQRNGIRVPEDMSIISNMATWEASRVHPGVTAIHRDIQGMTQMGLKMLTQRLKGKEIRESEVWVEPKLVTRNTVIPRNG